MELTKTQTVMFIYEDVFGDIALNTKDEQNKNLEIITDCMDFECESTVTDTLYGMFEHGPLYDGDVCSKQERDRLLEKGYCSKVVVKGQDGFNACTYKGQRLYRCLKAKYKIRQECKKANDIKEALNDLLNDCINFNGSKLSDCYLKQASDALK